MELNKIYNEDCLVGMKKIPGGGKLHYYRHSIQ